MERHLLYRDVVPMLHVQLDAELRGERRAEGEAVQRGANPVARNQHDQRSAALDKNIQARPLPRGTSHLIPHEFA